MRALAAFLAAALALAALPMSGQALSPAARAGQTGGPRPSTQQPDHSVRAFLARHCLQCHGGKKPKGNLGLDRLAPDLADAANREVWLTVLKRVQAGEMPPKSKARPTRQEIRALADWITTGTDAALAARTAEGRVVLRRLNRVEYQNTMRDLLGVTADLQEMLPLDASAHGFDNVGEALHVSSFLMERYLDAADTALNMAIANGPRPPLVKKRYSLKNQHQVKVSTERVYRVLGATVVLFSSSPWTTVITTEFYPPDRGRYRFRISASGFQSAGKPVTFCVNAGPMLMGTKNHLVGYFDAPADRPTVVEFVDHLAARSHISILPYGLARAPDVDKVGAGSYPGPGLAVQWVEVEGPLHETWPPASHRRLFGDLRQEPVPGNRQRLELVSDRPLADSERILRTFAGRAFRRPVTDADVKPFLDLVKRKLDAKDTFEQALRVGLKAVLVSPQFLFLRESPGKLDDFALASRLSYFLGSTMPDQELLTLASQGKLGEPTTLRRQVERLLKGPRASAFTENFVGQWLNLRDIDFTEPSPILYPEYDHLLRVSMVKETELFFAEVLRDDLSVTNFVASDFTMLNGRLARHYGIPGVEGWEFRKVRLPAGSHRGGVLTMASVLKVTANGTTTSPVVRGAFVLDRILGTPPPRPPADVPAIEPDIRGATTIREQLAKHRQISRCASCHAQIDPQGFALESFDVIGGWREHYRVTGNGKPVIHSGRRMPYLHGPRVDPADVLADGQRFGNVDEFKRLLLKNKEQLARALTCRLVTYATGAPPQAGDQAEVEAIVRRAGDHDYGLRTLVQEIVQSKLFRNK
jgi:mono/diheme cytochrome c family protein